MHRLLLLRGRHHGKVAWLWLSILTFFLARQLNHLRSERYHAHHSEEVVLMSMINPAFVRDNNFMGYTLYPEMDGDDQIGDDESGSEDEEEEEEGGEEKDGDDEEKEDPMDIIKSSPHKKHNKRAPKLKSVWDVVNWTCSEPSVKNKNRTAANNWTFLVSPPPPFNTSHYTSDGMNITCSMGCRNVTIPANVPNFIVIGAQKGGTSALAQYFKNVSTVLSSRMFEPHFFDRMHRALSMSNYSQERLCQSRSEYLHRAFNLAKYYNKSAEVYPSKLFSFEKSPSYIRIPGTAFRVYSTYPEIKLIAILRNPVDRAYSQYAMEFGRGMKVGKSFDVCVQWAVESLREANLTLAPTLFEYVQAADQPPVDDENFFVPPAMTLETFLHMVHTSTTFHPIKKDRRMHTNNLYAGMYALHLAEWLQYFEVGKSIMVVQYEKLLANKSGVFGEICDFLGIPRVDLHHAFFTRDFSPYRKKNPRNKELQPLQDNTREFLQRFYQPYNQKLYELLGEEWRNAWD